MYDFFRSWSVRGSCPVPSTINVTEIECDEEVISEAVSFRFGDAESSVNIEADHRSRCWSLDIISSNKISTTPSPLKMGVLPSTTTNGDITWRAEAGVEEKLPVTIEYVTINLNNTDDYFYNFSISKILCKFVYSKWGFETNFCFKMNSKEVIDCHTRLIMHS